jgi:rubrerythrin
MLEMDKITFKSGRDGGFEFERDLTVLEILGIAIKAEVSSYGLYKRFALRVANPVVKQRIAGLAEDEKNHYQLLAGKYAELSGEAAPPIPDTGDLRRMDVDIEKMNNKEVLELAAAKEAQAQKFYAAAAAKAVDLAGKAVLEYLVGMERGHEEVLRQEIKMLERNPLWHEQQAGRFFHVGP